MWHPPGSLLTNGNGAFPLPIRIPSGGGGADAGRRLTAVHWGRRLKVLDGAGVGPAECDAARAAFAGRLTPELLAERCPRGG